MHTHMYAHTHTHSCVLALMHAHTRTHSHALSHSRTRVCSHSCILSCMFILMHTHAHSCTLISTQSQAVGPASTIPRRLQLSPVATLFCSCVPVLTFLPPRVGGGLLSLSPGSLLSLLPDSIKPSERPAHLRVSVTAFWKREKLGRCLQWDPQPTASLPGVNRSLPGLGLGLHWQYRSVTVGLLSPRELHRVGPTCLGWLLPERLQSSG